MIAFFKENQRFTGHIIATSSDADGILAKCTTKNIRDRERAEAIQKKIYDMDVSDEDLEKTNKKLSKAKEELESFKTEKKEIEKRAKKNFTKKYERAEKITDAEEKEKALDEIRKEEQDSKLADSELEKIKGKISRKQKRITQLAGEKKKTEVSLSDKKALEEEIKQINENHFDEQRLYEEAEKRLSLLKSVFADDFYIEFMFHGKEEEAVSMPILEQLAFDTGTKTILSNEVHILNDTEDDIARWFAVKSLNGNSWVDRIPEAREYRMKTEEEIANYIFGLTSEEAINNSLRNMSDIADSCSFAWPEEKHYPKYESPDGKTAEQTLCDKTKENIKKLFKGNEWTKEYDDRLKYELSVINKTGYADYTLIISEILEEGRKGNHDGKIGSYIGPGRGSGAGSIVNYLMRITHIDPIKYDLIFERYLNVERISPPDIDSDIATSVRATLVRYITKKYSKQENKVGVCTITTKQRLTAKAAIRAAGRIVSSKYYGTAAKLYSVADRIAKEIPNELHITLGECLESLNDTFPDDTEQEIIYYATLIENVLSGYGTCLPGMIISDNGDVTEYAPVINMGTTEEPVWNIQYDKEESEGIGMLKLDALGLTTLDTISNTMQRVYETRGKKIDIDNIMFEDKVFQGIYQKGDTNGVFQCESAGMKKMWLQLKPDCIDDIIAGVALYRPGPMDFIPDYIKGKHNPKSIHYITKQLEPILSKTYGQIVYQEQVMRIVRDLAGFSMGRSDLVRRAMSKKKESIMNAERKNFIYGNKEENIPGCISNGIREEDAGKIYDLMIDFAKYAFNKSHAAAYAIVSYQSAWLKYHYPKEFLIETMNLEKPENLPIFIEECRRKGYVVKNPDINKSSLAFDEYDDEIYYGLGSVKGVKNNASKIIENRGTGYRNFQDFLFRSEANKSVVKALICAGAFDSMDYTRAGLLSIYESLMTKTQKYKLLKTRIAQKEEKLKVGSYKTATEEKRLISSLDKDTTTASQIYEELKNVFIPYLKDKQEDILEMEKEYLFTYISRHPLDGYMEILKNYTPLSDIEEGDVKVAGIVSDIKIVTTKKTNREMAIFTISDKTDKKKVVCFPDTYEKYSTFLREDNILRIYGAYKKEYNGDEMNIIPTYINQVASKENQYLVRIKNMDEWENETAEVIRPYLASNGSGVILYDESRGILVPTDLHIPKGVELKGIDYSIARTFLPNIKKGDY